MREVQIWADGACAGNPGKGGWGAILKYGTAHKEISGFNPQTTNNQMELTAVIEALLALKEPCKVTLTTDSKYVVDNINNGWAVNARQRGWRKSNKQAFLNSELWEKLLSLMEIHDVKFEWVKGHNNNPYNERCDFLAVSAYQNT